MYKDKMLAEKMLNYRARHNISQTTLAKLCCVSVQTINSIEQCRQEPSALTRQKILNIVLKKEND